MATYFGALPYTPFSGIPDESYVSREQATYYHDAPSASQASSSLTSPAFSEGDPTPSRGVSPAGDDVVSRGHEHARPLIRQDSLPSRFARKDRSFYEENVSQESAPVPSIFDMLVTAAAAEELEGTERPSNVPCAMESASAATTYAPYDDDGHATVDDDSHAMVDVDNHATADVDNHATADVDGHAMVDNDTDVAMLSESDDEDTEDEDFAIVESEDDDEDDEYEEPARKRARRSPVAKKSAPAKAASTKKKSTPTKESTPTKKSASSAKTSPPAKKDSPPKTSASARTSPRAKTSSASATTPSASPKTSPRAKKIPSPGNASASAKSTSASAKNSSAPSKKTTTPPKKRASRSKKGSSPSATTSDTDAEMRSSTTSDADADAEMSYDEMVANIGSVKTLPWTTEGVKAFVVSFIKRSDARRAAVKRKAEEAKQKKIEEAAEAAAKKEAEAAKKAAGEEVVEEEGKGQGKKAPAPTTTGKRKRGPIIEVIDEDNDLDEYELDDGDDCNCHASTSTSTLPCTCGPSSKKTCHALSQRIELMRTDPTLTSFGAHHAMCAGCGAQIRTDIRWEFYFKALWGKHSLEKCAGLRKWEESPPSAEKMEEWQKSRDASAEDAKVYFTMMADKGTSKCVCKELGREVEIIKKYEEDKAVRDAKKPKKPEESKNEHEDAASKVVGAESEDEDSEERAATPIPARPTRKLPKRAAARK